jgi:G3E family GTPase
MRIIIVSGMLGVGKTSTVLKLIDLLMRRGYKVAVIENEFGSKGVDGEIIRKNGMEVMELEGGCVCCTMKAGLVTALRYLDSDVKPDIVIVEPSGIADPQHIFGIQDVAGMNISSVSAVIVTDAERFMKMKRMFERPLRNQFSVANVVLLNKVDTVTEEEADAIESEIRSFGYAGKIIRTQAEEGRNMELVPDEIL